jgi:hypothetical protein
MGDVSDFYSCLTTDKGYAALNFKFKTYLVYPTGFTKDLADCLTAGKLKVKRRFSDLGFGDTGGSYMPDADHYSISAAFSIKVNKNRIILAHESTHALLDWQRLGKIPDPDSEAVAYIAEAIYVRTMGWTPLVDPATGAPHPIRAAADAAAQAVLAGGYDLTANQGAAVESAVRASSHYGPKAADFFISDGIG